MTTRQNKQVDEMTSLQNCQLMKLLIYKLIIGQNEKKNHKNTK